MDFTPVFIDHEEEFIDPRQVLPPSFLSDYGNLNKTPTHFVEPPSDPSSPSTAAFPSPLTPHDPRPSARHKIPFTHSFNSNPLFPTSSLTRSPSGHTSSTLRESTLTDDDLMSSPVAISGFPDRPRPRDTSRKSPPCPVPSRPGFARISPTVSPDNLSPVSPESVMHHASDTARMMNMVTDGRFRGFASKRPSRSGGGGETPPFNKTH